MTVTRHGSETTAHTPRHRPSIHQVCAFALNMTDAAARAAAAPFAPWGWKEPRAMFHLPGFGDGGSQRGRTS
jgi:hypothetical protein